MVIVHPCIDTYVLSTEMFFLPTGPHMSLSELTYTLALLPAEEWEDVGGRMNVPEPRLRMIMSEFQSNEERKAEVLRVYVTEHPQLTWEHVSDAVYHLKNGEHHTVLDRLQPILLTGDLSVLAILSVPPMLFFSVTPVLFFPSLTLSLSLSVVHLVVIRLFSEICLAHVAPVSIDLSQ